MQHPLYVSAMFPHLALPDGPIPYYPYMYPPAFTLGNHHIHPEPPSSNGKIEHPGVEADRKANRTAESEARSRYTFRLFAYVLYQVFLLFFKL